MIMVIGIVAFSIGTSPLFTLSNDIIIGTAPPERAGAASAISETCAELGGALGIALLGSVWTFVYRSRMADGVTQNLTPEMTEAAARTLGAALAAAETLPTAAAADLTNTARTAFLLGLKVTAAICTLLVLVMAVVALVQLRNLRPSEAGPVHEVS
jgi:MFS transporter, DHA2 family, multidrug resistance protein